VGVVDLLEMVEVQQRDAQRAAGSHRPDDLPLRLALPGGRVEQTGLGVHAGLGQQLRVHHEPPGQQDGGHGQDGQHRVDGDHHGDEDAQVHLGEVGEQSLAVQRDTGHPGGGVGELHRDDDQGIVQEPAGELGRGHGRRPGQGMRPGAERAPGEGRGDGAEHQRRGSVGQADRGAGEHAPVDRPAVHPPLREDQQRRRDHHGKHRRQQDRHRQHPGGQEVPDQAALQVGHPRGHHHGDRAAAQQQAEPRQVTGQPGGRRRGHRDQREGRHGHGTDIGPYQPGKPPPRPVPDGQPRGQQAGRRGCDGRGSHVSPFRMRRDESADSWMLTVKDYFRIATITHFCAFS
jgi:hypothetical protein